MTWEIDYDSPGYVRITSEGKLTIEDCKKCVDELLAHDLWIPGRNILMDCRKNDLNGITYDDFQCIGEYQAARNHRYGNGKMALLMNSTRDYGMGRLYELLNDPIVSCNIKVFVSEREAEKWLLAPRGSGAAAL